MKFKISFWLLLLLSLGASFGLEIFPLIISVLVHEAGHILALKLLGGYVGEIKADLKGIEFKMERTALFTGKEIILVSMAGPVAGLLFAAAAFIWRLDELFKINLLLSLFNLLPLKGLDGGEILKELKESR